jgi:hypothetical protein
MSELDGLRALVSDAGTLHGIHHKLVFTIRYYDAAGWYAETAWYDDASPFWTSVLAPPGPPSADVRVLPAHESAPAAD